MKKSSTLFFILVLMAISIEGKTQVADTLEWSVLFGGDKAGFLKKIERPDGSITEWYQYNDRGRGDSTIANYRYDNEGYLTFIDASGVDYYKKPVYEKYQITNGEAFWENNTEKDQKKLAGKANYVPLNIAAGTLYTNYFKSANQTIQLLPTGTSTLKVLTEHTLDNGKKIRLIATVGAELTPSYTWIDEHNEFFALPGNWFASIRKGYESYNEEMLTIQEAYKSKYFEDIAQKLSIKTQTGIVVTNAKLFDAKTGKVKPDATILIEDGIIKEVIFGKTNIPKDFRIVDANKKFVMPGLWDMHVHYDDASTGILHLACGVTNVRDMGNSLDLLDRKKQIDEGKVLGPRIQAMCGFIDGAGPYAGPIGEKINSADEGKAAVRKYAELGYQQIKLYSSVKPEWVKPIIEEAKQYKLRVSGHIPAFMIAEEAIEAGFNEIQHINMVFLNFYGKDLDTRTPARFITVAQKAAFFDFQHEDFKKFVQKLKSLQITIDPTVTVFEQMFIGKQGETNPSFQTIAHRLPLNIQRYLKTGPSLDIPVGQEETYKKSFDNMLKMVKVLHENKVILIPGTDGFAGFTLHRELENYVKAGIPNKEVLKMATLTAATVAKRENDYGSIEKGKIADLIIIDGDPTKHMEDIRRVETVIKDNAIYYTRDLFSALSIAPFK